MENPGSRLTTEQALAISDRELPFRSRDAEQFDRLRTALAEAQRKLDASEAENEELRAGLRAVKDLIDDSHGVVGLHLNGDEAPWSELRTGGRFEEWLVDFDRAIREARRGE